MENVDLSDFQKEATYPRNKEYALDQWIKNEIADVSKSLASAIFFYPVSG